MTTWAVSMADSSDQSIVSSPHITLQKDGMCLGSKRPLGRTIVITPIELPVLNMLSREILE